MPAWLIVSGGLASILAAAGAYLAGVSAAGAVGILLGMLLLTGITGNIVETRRVCRRVTDLIAAGDTAGAGRLLARARRKLGKNPEFQRLEKLVESGAEPEKPAIEPREPVIEPEKPAREPQKPGREPEKPVLEPREPVREPEEPQGEPQEPVLAPADPVTSGLAMTVMALILPALVPLAGLPFALALLAVSILLHVKAKLPWDRPAARIGLAVSLLSLLFFGVGVLGRAATPGGGPEIDFLFHTAGGHSLRSVVIMLAVLLGSVILHECAHAAAARISGDSTALEAGRLTLNPLRHIDPFGSIVLPIVLSLIPGAMAFGWAKPVPVRPRRYAHRRRGEAFVSVAGVAANLLLALVSTGLLLLAAAVLKRLRPASDLGAVSQLFVEIDLGDLPLAPVWETVVETLKAGILVNSVLAVLNLLPVPPLDGSRILRALLPVTGQRLLDRAAPLGLLLFLLIAFTDAVVWVFFPAVILAVVLAMVPALLLGLG